MKFGGSYLFMPFQLIWYLIKDMYYAIFKRKHQILYGVTLYCGEVGSGKTMSMLQYALFKKQQDPRILLWSNFPFEGVDHVYCDLAEIAKAPSYSIILIAEGSLMANNRDWQTFPREVVELLTQNRKWGSGGDRPPGVKILADVQEPTMLDKVFRHLTNEVVHCRSYADFGNFPRLIVQTFHTPQAYFYSAEGKKKNKGIYLYVATDYLRNVYDTFAIIRQGSAGATVE